MLTGYNLDRQVTRVDYSDDVSTVVHYEGGGECGVAPTARVCRVDQSDASGTATITPGYDDVTGQLRSLGRSDGASLAFDNDGPLLRQVTWTFADLATSSVGFDYDGQMQLGGTSVDGFDDDVCFGYDLDGLMTAVGEGTYQSCTSKMSVDREPTSGRVTAATVGSAVTTYRYNGFGELAEVATTYANGVFALIYERDAPTMEDRDALGRVTFVEEAISDGAPTACTADAECSAGERCVTLAEGSAQQASVCLTTTPRWYTYDAQDRLQAVWESAPPVDPDCDAVPRQAGLLACWKYDDNGNRVEALSCDGGAAPTCTSATAVVDGQDRLTQIGAISLYYDARGSLYRRDDDTVGAEQEQCFTYDVAGNLRQALIGTTDCTAAGNTVVTYEIDAQGRRVGRTVAVGSTVTETRWVYRDRLNPIAQIAVPASGDPFVQARFVYGTRGHVPDFMYWRADELSPWATYRLVTNQLGSVRRIVDVGDGTVAQEIDYDAWGNADVTTNLTGFSQPFGFAGGLWDSETRLVRFGARDYDPEIGRWTAKDPIRFAGGDTNLYAYVGNDPVNRIDPSGLSYEILWEAAECYEAGQERFRRRVRDWLACEGPWPDPPPNFGDCLADLIQRDHNNDPCAWQNNLDAIAVEYIVRCLEERVLDVFPDAYYGHTLRQVRAAARRGYPQARFAWELLRNARRR